MIKTIEREEFYLPEDLAKRFRVSLSTIYKLIRQGELPHIRLGKIYRIPASNLQRYIAERRAPQISHPHKIPLAVRRFLSGLRSSKHARNVHEVWLYGSYARGDYTPDSDIDLLIVTREKTIEASNALEELSEKAMATSDYQDLLSIQEIDQTQWQEMTEKRFPLAQSILREGVLVWKHH